MICNPIPEEYFGIKKEENMIETQKFVRKPFHIEGVLVTEENFEQVAEWCGGTIKTAEDPNGGTSSRWIKLKVIQPLNRRQTQAFVGDWVTMSERGFKVFTDKAFQKSFDQAEERILYTMEDAIAQCGEDVNQLVLEGVDA